MKRKQVIDTIATQISHMEGFYIKASVAAKNNNPGSLRSWGKVPTKQGYAVFPTVEDGWVALETQVAKNVDRGLSFAEFFAGKPGVYGGYAPGTDHNYPIRYAEFVAAPFEVPISTVISSLIKEPVHVA